MVKEIEKLLNDLENFKKTHLEIAKEMFEVDKGNVYPLDLFALGIIKRSLMLINGFCTLIRKNNFTSAAPLVRLHLDNLLQISAAFISKNPHVFAIEKLKGTQTKKLKDVYGKKMLDSYLAERLSMKNETSWVKRVYEESSKFIHFSDKHILITAKKVNKDRTVEFLIPSDEEIIPDNAKLEVVAAMMAITNELFRYLYGWVKTKNNK